VAKRNSPRPGRSRKRRARSQKAATSAPAALAAEHTTLERDANPARRARPARSRAADLGAGPFGGGSTAMGERPQAPWHPLPLSELLILVGAIGAIFAWSRGIERNGSLLVAGVAAVAIGTIEFTLREHLSGYRSHTILLALLPAIVFHSVVVLLVTLSGPLPRWLNLALLPIDGALFAVLFKLLRGRFLDARQRRIVAGGR
jgi:hypothetical protein